VGGEVSDAIMPLLRHGARFPEGIKQLAAWLGEGKLKYAESVVEGFENTPQAFIGLFTGENLGKQIVKVAG
jgi:NADPH-dependent curcumin reductase CurA